MCFTFMIAKIFYLDYEPPSYPSLTEIHVRYLLEDPCSFLWGFYWIIFYNLFLYFQTFVVPLVHPACDIVLFTLERLKSSTLVFHLQLSSHQTLQRNKTSFVAWKLKPTISSIPKHSYSTLQLWLCH